MTLQEFMALPDGTKGRMVLPSGRVHKVEIYFGKLCWRKTGVVGVSTWVLAATFELTETKPAETPGVIEVQI